MRVAALQFDVRRDAIAENQAVVRAGLERAAADGISLVLLPELWPGSFPRGDMEPWLEPNQRAVEELAAWSAELGLVVAGSALAPGAPGEKPRNRMHVHDRGREVIAYDKVHLFSPTGETLSFSAGAEPPPTVETSLGRIGAVICYDLRFGPLTRRCFLDGAEILLCPAQWPVTRQSHWRALVCGRAVENQCFVVAANRTGTELLGKQRELEFPGNSLVCDPGGNPLAEGHGEVGLVSAEIDLELARALRKRVPIARDQRDELYRSW